MRLHEYSNDFRDLITLTAQYIHIPAGAVKRDYYIVMMLQRLAQSDMAQLCVFKGGSSLSKCYPGSIERFSEDIDLTYIPQNTFTDKQYDRALKKIETLMSADFSIQKIPEERNSRNKSSYIWYDKADSDNGKVKLEIGSSVRPDPYAKRVLRTYIQDYLYAYHMEKTAEEYNLIDVAINTLAIERTFLDKVMAVKRHAICHSIEHKVRHIYDVTMLYKRNDIQLFLADGVHLKKLLQETKQTDSFYLLKRGISKDYNPTGPYDFPSWEEYFSDKVRMRYESLHIDLLYSDQKQDFSHAIYVFQRISDRFAELGE